MARVLVVTGAAGFIGSHLADALRGRGPEVVDLDALCQSTPRIRLAAGETAEGARRQRRFLGQGAHCATSDRAAGPGGQLHSGQKWRANEGRW
ncbi:NAD-dependent epimerase/dehydratase family protein [Micromonospora sp. NPDC023966]|uniref:NAD-dependent epimerase/dehydratase family protein n=1 Tax=Micromonospora sp. NPDC023966 TaxID=3154699 RepID=UPI0034073B73